MFSYEVNNIKVSYKLISSRLTQQLEELAADGNRESTSKRWGNFFVFRKHNFVYVIFYKGHVNGTKLKSISEIETSKKILMQSIVGHCQVSNVKIDNITASGSVFSVEERGVKKVNLFRLCDFLKKEKIKHRYNPHRFPGLNFRLLNVTFLLFNSGKFIVIGSKSFENLPLIIDEFSKYMGRFLLG